MAKATGTREARATLRYSRMTASKARFVLDQIRGLHVTEARRLLRFSTRGATDPIGKLLESAIANAEDALNADAETLFVTQCWADEGPTLKRWQPRAQGRAYRIRKRTTHITIVVEPREV